MNQALEAAWDAYGEVMFFGVLAWLGFAVIVGAISRSRASRMKRRK